MTDAKPTRGAANAATHSTEGLDVAQLTYEAALSELESIIARIEAGDVPLDESLRQYRRGAALVRRCRDVLDGARSEVERIAASDLIARVDEVKPQSAPR
ncbi:MAG: exodeoxyribonuclease VII small subunit [Phycisphaerales bacterium]|nr:exodeoxyribonuclease VII small subunit [Phycisphaerales bacterium]